MPKNQEKKPSTKKRPVLIGLLVGVVVVGVVATLITGNLKEAQARARDLERKNDLKEVQQALEDYKEENEKYPDGLNDLESKYMQEVPDDPLNKDPHVYVYTPASDEDDYTLTAVLEIRGTIECSGGSECVVTLSGS